MESSPPLETVYQAIYTLNHNPDSAGKEKASQWLGALQRSVFAWKVADEMLHQKRDLESCYFAAQTMRTKIQLSFHELPPESHISLRDSLIEHISQVNEQTNTIIVTQLCLALADLALLMAQWQKPLEDLIKRFGQSNLWPLLEILTVLPEEVNSRSLRLGANRRNDVMGELKSSSKMVSECLKACLSNGSDNPTMHVKVLRCFTSWVSIQAISLSEISNNLIVGHAFHILANHQAPSGVHEAATDCMCALLDCMCDRQCEKELEVQVFSGVLALEEGYHLSVAQEDTEKSINYCRIFTELAESFFDKIVNESSENKPHYAVKILDLVAEITFNLWFRLSEVLYQKNCISLTAVFKPYIERLITAVCGHCQMEPDHEGILEDSDDFYDFRVKVSELIKDVVFIVGSSNCFRQMFLHLQSPGVTWDSSEAALFIMQAVAKNILPEEKEVVPKVVEAILNLPENTHVAVRHTSVLLLGELCEWIENHSETLEPILNFLLYCLHKPMLATAAANSLQSICSACSDHMGVHFNGLVQIVQSLDNFAISNDAAIGLLKGVAVILGGLPPDEIQRAMKQLCWIQVTPLCELVETSVKTEKGTKTDPVLWLDRLATIFRHTSPVVENGKIHPCQPVITEIWPVLSNICTKYQADSRIMERCCRCLRFAIRCVGKQSLHLLEPLVKQIVTLYQQNQHSCFLYMGSILVDEYAADPTCTPGLLAMLQAFLEPTFALLEDPPNQGSDPTVGDTRFSAAGLGLKNHPDTVDDLFRLCARFLQRAPVPFLQSPAIAPIVRCALMACTLEHRDANGSVMKFFNDLFYCGRNHEEREDFELRRNLVQRLIMDSGQVLLNNLIHASIFCLHSYMLSDVADVIMELMLFNRMAFFQWLEVTVKSLPTTNAGGSVTVTQKQLADFHRLLTRSEGSKDVTHALRDFALLYR
ncbi:hypothetical protein J437_LFUL003259 [Ladona fulva]|uniref:Transportin-3 n=1 Tax=Ladona fulva TaxID=123851 RepID=A0A8K0JTP5_LADFU|nr:hypothetical protein J437_LFUL003259 [Ladona fulva]